MNIVLDRKLLINLLHKTISPTVSKTNFPILSTVLIDFSDKKMKVTATDLELTIISYLEISQDIKASFCVSLTKFLSILKELSSVEVTLKLQKNFLWITCENCELKLNIIDPQEFPKPPTLKDKEVIKLSPEILGEMIKFSSFSVFVGEGNYVLSGIFCEIEKNKIRLTSSDTKRLSSIERALPSNQPELNTRKTFIIPHKAIIELSKLIKESEQELLLVIGKNQIGFDLKDTQIITQLIEGEFPEYKKYIPKEAEHKLKIDREKFLSSLKRASVLSAPEYYSVKLEVSKNKLMVSKATPQLGEYKEEIDVDYKGKNITLGFNPDYLKDVLKVVEEDEVSLDLYDPEKPLVLRNNGYIYLALPMRLT
ncbi:MAG: DNA polymerase III subunit beta [Candidatus Omnitrophica bacterium]|nr:DNA polymerase III subunit beta [Candidatus Omnitrophota bacterium]